MRFFGFRNYSTKQISGHHASFLSPHQTIGSEENQGLADFGVIKHYGWKKVTIFQLDVDSFEIVRLSLIIHMHKCRYTKRTNILG